MTFPGLLICWHPKNPHGTPWGGVGQICLAENESHIYPNMCPKFGCGPTDKGKLQLYIVDLCIYSYIKRAHSTHHSLRADNVIRRSHIAPLQICVIYYPWLVFLVSHTRSIEYRSGDVTSPWHDYRFPVLNDSVYSPTQLIKCMHTLSYRPLPACIIHIREIYKLTNAQKIFNSFSA